MLELGSLQVVETSLASRDCSGRKQGEYHLSLHYPPFADHVLPLDKCSEAGFCQWDIRWRQLFPADIIDHLRRFFELYAVPIEYPSRFEDGVDILALDDLPHAVGEIDQTVLVDYLHLLNQEERVQVED